MRIFALELNNDLKGIAERKAYIERLIAKLPSPDLVLLPELAVCSCTKELFNKFKIQIIIQLGWLTNDISYGILCTSIH